MRLCAALLGCLWFAGCNDDPPTRTEPESARRSGDARPTYASESERMTAMLRHFEEGVLEFDGRKLSGRDVAKQLLTWKNLAKDERSIAAQDMALLEKLPRLLQQHHAGSQDKQALFQTGSVLTSELLNEREHIRSTAHACLRAIYRVDGPEYRASDSLYARSGGQLAWLKFVNAQR